MATIIVPAVLRELTDGANRVEAAGENLRQVIDNLDAAYPGFKERLIQDGAIRPEISIAVNGGIISAGLIEPVPEGAEINILPAISGG